MSWLKPTSIRLLDRAAYRALPESVTVREVRIRVARPGFRTRSAVVTPLLDPRQASKEEQAGLYRARRHVELDLRSIKAVMQVGELRGKAPEVVRKEVWAHVVAYNLIRTVMARAAAWHAVPPRSISFKGATQTLDAFRPILELRAAADRSDRFESRRKKRRKDYCGWFTEPRAELKRKMAQGVNQK